MSIIDVVCPVYNGARFLPEFLAGLREQTHVDWRLWLRDDGSDDHSRSIIQDAVTSDPERFHLLQGAPPRLGAAQSFGCLLEDLRARGEATYVMFADQDDVWLPEKIERTLRAMDEAEMSERMVGRAATPILVHSDLHVVDEQLHTIDRSAWAFSGLRPEPATLRRFALRSVVVGATCMINRPLLSLGLPVPPEAMMHDWWFACVAAAFGRVVSLPEATLLYRQHNSNAVGARPRSAFSLSAVVRALGEKAQYRRDVDAGARQAEAFLSRFASRLNDDDRRLLESYARVRAETGVRRKLRVLRLRGTNERGLLGALGALLRA